MKRGYLWLDWIELGARGWQIDETGAGRHYDDRDGYRSGETCHEDCYAHLDRTTLHLICVGCRDFYCSVLNDLIAAGLIRECQIPRWATESTVTASTSASPDKIIRLDCNFGGPRYWESAR